MVMMMYDSRCMLSDVWCAMYDVGCKIIMKMRTDENDDGDGV